MKWLLSVLTVSFLCFSALKAQFPGCDQWSMGGNLTITQPIGDMEYNGFKTNYGVTFNFLYNLTPELPLVNYHIGARITGGITGAESENIILENPRNALADNRLYNTLADLLITGRMVLRPEKRVHQYFDFYAGGRVTGTNEDIRLRRNYSGYDRTSSNRVAQSINWAWGSGTGILIKISPNAFFDLGVNYMRSEYQTFADLNSYDVRNDVPSYEIVNSQAYSFGFHIGFHVKLNCHRGDYYEENSQRNQRRRTISKKRPTTKKRFPQKNRSY